MHLFNNRRTQSTSVHLEMYIAVFAGRLSLDCQPTEAGIVRSGYCAVRGPVPRHLNLHGYQGIALRVMTDGRQYVQYMYSFKY